MRRIVPLHVRLTKSEYEYVRQAAEQAGLSMAAFIRSLVRMQRARTDVLQKGGTTSIVDYNGNTRVLPEQASSTGAT